MSTLNVSNITDGTDTVGTSYVLNGSAKAWVSFSTTTTTAINDSINISSLTDNGAGDTTANLTNNMSSTSYMFIGGLGWNATGAVNARTVYQTARTVSSSRSRTYYTDVSSSNATDADYNGVSIYGDLA